MGASLDRKLRQILTDNGCYLVRQGKGSHEIWHNPSMKVNFAVSHDIRSRFTANAILKQAGLIDRV
jgi:predicted RNA binding protein YcfA (HicA-like mRNA interferase family)